MRQVWARLGLGWQAVGGGGTGRETGRRSQVAPRNSIQLGRCRRSGWTRHLNSHRGTKLLFVMVVQEGSEEMTDGEERVNGGAERGQEEQEEETSDAPEEAELELGR